MEDEGFAFCEDCGEPTEDGAALCPSCQRRDDWLTYYDWEYDEERIEELARS